MSKIKINSLKNRIIYYLFASLFVAFGIGAIVLYCITSNLHANWICTDSTIIKIQKDNVEVTYFVESLKDYLTGKLNEYNSTWKVGNVIPIKYDPSNPSSIVSNTAMGNILQIVVGVIFAVIGISLIVTQILRDVKNKGNKTISSKGNKKGKFNPQIIYSDSFNYAGSAKSSTLSEANSSEGLIDPMSFTAAAKKIDDHFNTYKFVSTKIHTKGCTVFDTDNNEVYVCKNEGRNIFKGSLFSFTNKLTGSTKLHRVGMSFTKVPTYQNPFMITDYFFKIDKEIVWEYIKSNNINIKQSYSNSTGCIDVLVNNVIVGHIYEPNVPDNTKLSKQFISSFKIPKEFKIECSPKFLDSVVLVAFTIQRIRLMRCN